MKKRICGFRQKLGIILAAGMIVSNMNFAVLPVSATDGDSDPTQVTADYTMDSPVSKIQEVIDTISSFPSQGDLQGKTSEELALLEEQVLSTNTMFCELKQNLDDSLSDDQKEQIASAESKLDELQSYFTNINSEESNDLTGQIETFAADNGSSITDAVYNRFVETIKNIAAGKQENTTVDIFDLLNTTSKVEDFNAAIGEITNNKDLIYTSLVSDCQNELFWHDKTAGFTINKNISYDTNGNVQGGTVICGFKVSAEYQKGGDEFTVDSQKLSSANDALANARKIVDENANKSDYEKLLAYKNAICELTSYDHDAAAMGDNAPDSVFQMVSVFDGNPDTKVVCEGYAKAFQYLCDLSTFKNAKCYTVSGNMAGGTGAGGHMWNIVSVGSNNYLVDVTNCDEGSVGAPDKLFMAVPVSGSWDASYTFAASRSINYSYYDNTKRLFGESILKLATTPYDPTKEPVEDDTNKPDTDKPGTDKPDTPDKPNKPSKPSKPSKPGSSSSGSSSSGSSSSNQSGNNTSTQTTTWAAETNSSDQNTYRLEVRSAIEVSAELAGNDTLNTPEKIESQIRNSLTAKGISNDNIRVYDVALQVYVNGAWQNVSAENFPAEGVTVTVPYPAGTDSTYNFVASHLFTKSMNGYSAGHIETFPESGTIKTSPAGISFTVHGLSPISVGWSKTAVNSNASANVSPKTGDHTTILLYMVLMIFAAAVMGTVYVKQIRIRRK